MTVRPRVPHNEEATRLTAVEKRDLAQIENGARAVLRQCEYLRRNLSAREDSGDDRMRFGLIAREAWYVWRAAARADRRSAKENGWYVFRWAVPRGYDRA